MSQLAATLVVPPNLTESQTGSLVTYSMPDGTEAFRVEQVPNPSNLSISDFLAQQLAADQSQSSSTLQSLYSQARDGTAVLPSPGAQEAILFKSVGEYLAYDQGYVRLSDTILIVTNVSLDSTTFINVIESAQEPIK